MVTKNTLSTIMDEHGQEIQGIKGVLRQFITTVNGMQAH